MPTTDPATDGSRPDRRQLRAHRIAAALVSLAIFAGAYLLALWGLGAYGSATAVAWHDFHAAERLDTLVVGSSFGQQGIDPVTLDARLGTRTVNLATPGQTPDDSLDAIKCGVGEKGVSHVILAVGLDSLGTRLDTNSHVAFVLGRYEGDPLGAASSLASFALRLDVVGTRDSVRALFPWTCLPTYSPRSVALNLRSRILGGDVARATEGLVRGWHYVGGGYGNYDRTIAPGDGRTSLQVFGSPHVDRRVWDEYAAICDWCREHNVSLTVVATPHPAYDIAAFGDDYPRIMGDFQRMVQARGATYLDLNLAHRDCYDPPLSDFDDFEHLNATGAERLTNVLARLIGPGGAGERDVVLGSYDDWDGWRREHLPQAGDTGRQS